MHGMKLFIKENRKKSPFAGMVIAESKLIKTLISIKLQAVDQSTIQFWTILSKGHRT